jgi:RND superfamily putative drug exporter
VAPLQAAPAPAAPPQPADLTPSLDYARNYDAPADNRDAVVPTISTRRRTDLSGGFRRTPPDEVPAPRSNEIPAQRRPADLGDLVTPPRPPSRPDDLAALQSADRGIPQSADRGIPGWRRAGETATDTQGKRPATLADQPPLNTGGEPETDLTRRPADLRDHLRATRPADLAQYTHNQKPEAPRRPATLADHISDPRTPVEDEA